mmetsp:Transcript_28342/g.83333  ORF Transcript_28342/g.83333 Transcript_28342/m.83333 type:complete len:202 (-) Transcript_28342:278-883(-)
MSGETERNDRVKAETKEMEHHARRRVRAYRLDSGATVLAVSPRTLAPKRCAVCTHTHTHRGVQRRPQRLLLSSRRLGAGLRPKDITRLMVLGLRTAGAAAAAPPLSSLGGCSPSSTAWSVRSKSRTSESSASCSSRSVASSATISSSSAPSQLCAAPMLSTRCDHSVELRRLESSSSAAPPSRLLAEAVAVEGHRCTSSSM